MAVNIFEKVDQLALLKDDYVIVGGGLLVALELLEWDEDIDICVGPETFGRFQADGWHQIDWHGKPLLQHDVYEVGVGFGPWSLEDLQADATTIQNIPFMSLGKLLQWKRQTGRPKDVRHIALIEAYLCQ